MHDGLDLVAVTGTSIYAAADGIVTGTGPNGGYGNWMRIDHAGKVTTVYGHLSGFAPGIEAGTRVSQGELIGFVGNTGRSTGAHLHFEIVVNGRSLDEHFGNAINQAEILMPFRVTGTEGHFNAMVKVEGGGYQGQAGAIRHGIARALLQSDPEATRLPLRQAGLLSRDPRMKERKKYGLKRARKAPQYTKR